MCKEGTMKTDWNSIRGMLNAAVDACERIETLPYAETDREATTDIGGQEVSVHDFLVSAWTYPEKLRYQNHTRTPRHPCRSPIRAGDSTHSVGNVPSCD